MKYGLLLEVILSLWVSVGIHLLSSLLDLCQLQEWVRWGDLHHYLSSAKRMCCASALAISCRPETGGISFSWQRLGTWHWAQLLEGRNTFSSNASTQWPKLGVFGLRVFIHPEQGPYSWVLVSVKAGKVELLRSGRGRWWEWRTWQPFQSSSPSFIW